MEEEQEILNSSLISLTTHFAQVRKWKIENLLPLQYWLEISVHRQINVFQVQFRLKQIVNAPANEKEQLLKELEEFAFRGIPDMKNSLIYNVVPSTSENELVSDNEYTY